MANEDKQSECSGISGACECETGFYFTCGRKMSNWIDGHYPYCKDTLHCKKVYYDEMKATSCVCIRSQNTHPLQLVEKQATKQTLNTTRRSRYRRCDTPTCQHIVSYNSSNYDDITEEINRKCQCCANDMLILLGEPKLDGKIFGVFLRFRRKWRRTVNKFPNRPRHQDEGFPKFLRKLHIKEITLLLSEHMEKNMTFLVVSYLIDN